MSHPRDENDFEKGYDQAVWEVLDEVRNRHRATYEEICKEFPKWKIAVHDQGYAAMTQELRFFIDHRAIHDRVTGRHVRTDPDFGPGRLCPEDGIEQCCDLLNSLAAALESDRALLRCIVAAWDYAGKAGVLSDGSVSQRMKALIDDARARVGEK